MFLFVRIWFLGAQGKNRERGATSRVRQQAGFLWRWQTAFNKN